MEHQEQTFRKKEIQEQTFRRKKENKLKNLGNLGNNHVPISICIYIAFWRRFM
jgi:hypothetical protein